MGKCRRAIRLQGRNAAAVQPSFHGRVAGGFLVGGVGSGAPVPPLRRPIGPTSRGDSGAVGAIGPTTTADGTQRCIRDSVNIAVDEFTFFFV